VGGRAIAGVKGCALPFFLALTWKEKDHFHCKPLAAPPFSLCWHFVSFVVAIVSGGSSHHCYAVTSWPFYRSIAGVGRARVRIYGYVCYTVHITTVLCTTKCTNMKGVRKSGRWCAGNSQCGPGKRLRRQSSHFTRVVKKCRPKRGRRARGRGGVPGRGCWRRRPLSPLAAVREGERRHYVVPLTNTLHVLQLADTVRPHREVHDDIDVENII